MLTTAVIAAVVAEV